MTVYGTYNPYLVALSVLVASFASYTALDLGGRIRASRAFARLGWLVTAAVAMGGGIWSMHFIAMLAFVLPMPVSFDVGLTALSLIVAIAVTGIGFYVIGTRRATGLQLAMSGVFVGIGIVGMHYTGMAAMRMPADLRYDRPLVALSVLIAIGASSAALWLAFRTPAIWQRIVAGAVMGLAISGMHYTGMAAAMFSTSSGAHAGHGTAAVEQAGLALAVASLTFVILVCALTASLFDRRIAVLAAREATLLRHSEEQLRKLYRATPLPLHSLGADGTIEGVSDAWLELLGYAREETLGRKLTDFMTPESAARYAETAWPSLRAGGEIKEAEFQLTRRSGEILDVLISARTEPAPGAFRTLAGVVDVTARKRTEETLRQSQRMEAIGQLTGGVAHDFNNLLMVISGAAHKLGKSANDENVLRARDMIVSAVKRGQTLTKQLLSFARRQALEAEVVDLAELLPNLAEMLRRSLRGDIEIRISAPDCPCRVRIDPAEFELALLNLGVNARDAMPDGGIVNVSVKHTRLSGDPNADALAGDFIVVEVADTGLGIARDVLPRVFEPFFTTKGPEKGTGLGLSQVYGFAKQSGGNASVRSTPGRGTVVTLFLPATEAPIRGPAPELRGQDDHVAGRSNETVLIVEDNADVAAVSSDYFQQMGYRVELVPTGLEALERLRGTPSYALVFSDILMPGNVGGLDLARIVRQRQPALPVLLTTGYSGSVQDAVREGFPIIQKPYELRDLAKAVRGVCARNEAAAEFAGASGRPG
jgi:PAS domain S-box-containing protein